MADTVLNHITDTRVESRAGMVNPDYRVICSCGWQDKALTEVDASNLATHHKRTLGRKRNPA